MIHSCFDTCGMYRTLDSSKMEGFAHKPVFLLGASLGGCISVNAIHRHVGFQSSYWRVSVENEQHDMTC